ncbi:MAG: MOSC domain-containing protein [Actinomycetota bacterium]|nr:MOSC domain-containing protein [Actinomycetota bacterium]
MGIEMVGINRYLVKSCRGQPVTDAVVERCGLAGDRRWMVIDTRGRTVTARERPTLVLVAPEATCDGLTLRAPGRPPLAVAFPAPNPMLARVHSHEVAATPADEDAHAWFSELLEEDVRLVYLDDPTRRRPNPAYSEPDDRVSLADGYPVLLTTTESLDALNELAAVGPHAGEGPLPMTRFRPNLVVAGAREWAEDGWRRVRIGPCEFRVVKRCDRCVLTTVHPDTAVKGREPLYTLARHRRWDGKTWFGVNLVPDNPGVTVSVGDPVEVLE